MLNVSQHSQESNFTGVSFLINIVVAFNLNLSFFKKRSRYWCFPDSYLKFLTKTFLKREKKHCYKNRSIVIRNVDQRSQIYLRSFFCNFAKISVFQQGVSRVYSDNRLFYQSKKITESSKSLTIEFWQSLTCQNLTGQTWLIDIYAMLPQNVSLLECFWRSQIYFIRYYNKPTEITWNHFCDGFLENQKYLREMFLRRLTQQTFAGLRDILKTSSTRLQRNSFTSFKTPGRRLAKTSWRCFKDVLKTSWKTKNWYAEDVFKTSWRHVVKTSWRHVLKASWRHILKTSSRRLAGKNVYWWYLHLTNLNVNLTNLCFTNLYLTNVRWIHNALLRTQQFRYSSYFETQAAFLF